MSNIIAISGKARAGKSTAARVITGLLAEYQIISFAAPLKQMLADEFPDLVTMDDLLNHKNKVIEINGRQMTVRELMIEFGRLYRAIDADYWVKKALRKAQPILLARAGGVVIDDLRYPNELRILEKMGARIVRVHRPGIELIDDPSETLLDNHDFREVIHNDSDLNAYTASVVDLFTAGN